MDHEATISLVKERAGGRAALATRLGISPQAISQWREIPVDRVMDVEAITGIPRSALRPDIYPPHREAAA